MVLGKVPNDCWEPDNLLIRDKRQDEACRTVSGKVLDDPLVPDDPLIRDDRQGEASRV